MTPRSASAILRTLADTAPAVSDADLLRRFQARDEQAFAALVRRYGRLVWAVCRSLTRSEADADDAFQATFLVLMENAGKVRDAGKLPAWLHGVAYKVCAKARHSAGRRRARERATAPREGASSVVPDSAWDRALAAVHEEVAQLPETLRVPFVLCCLGGAGVTEAAERLGWKLGTLSGRLARAKDVVLARLERRGLALGVAASIGTGALPAAVSAKAEALARVGLVVPNSILQLSRGAIGMTATTVKILAAAVVLTCGAGLSVGTGWPGHADAQPPNIVEEVQQLVNGLGPAEASQKADRGTFKTAQNEYALIPVADVAQSKFGVLLGEYEKRGWEYSGTTPLVEPKQLVWVFRRPVKAEHATVIEAEVARLKEREEVARVKAKEEVDRLTAELAEVKNRDAQQLEVKFDKTSSPLDPGVLASVLADLGHKKFGKGRKFNVAYLNGVVTVVGDKEVNEWATGVVKSLAVK